MFVVKNEVFVYIIGIDVVLFWGEEGYLVWFIV